MPEPTTNLSITRPQQNQHISIDKTADTQNLVLDFDPSEATVARAANDLVFTFSDGATTVVKDFFVSADNALPNFEVGGAVVNGATLLASLNQDMDLATAAGPSSSSTSSGGAGDYADATGALLGGIDRLGSLGTNQWAKTTEAPEFMPNTLASVATPAAEDAPLTPQVGNNERFIMYMDTPAGNLSMAGLAQAAQHAAASIVGAPSKYGTATVADGKVVYTMNADGAESLASSEFPIVDYVTYLDANGIQHTIQVVLTTNPSFTSTDFTDPTLPNFQPSEETHYSHKTDGAYTINATKGNDVLTFGSAITSDSANNSDINSLTGNDTITVNGNVLATTNGTTSITVNGAESHIDINAHSANPTAAVNAAGKNAEVTINVGGGTLDIDNTGAGRGVRAWGGGTVTIDGVKDMQIDTDGQCIQASMSDSMGSIQDKTQAQVHVNMANGGANINLESTAGFGIGTQYGQVSINGGTGTDTLTVTSKDHTISSTAGDITISNIENVEINTNGGGMVSWAYTTYTAKNTISGADSVSIKATTALNTNDTVMAMYATSSGSTAGSNGNAGGNYVTTKEMDIIATTSGSGKAYGMLAGPRTTQNGGSPENHILANGESLNLTMKVTNTTNADNAYAMYANGPDLANNKITGGNGADNIDITGRIYGANHGKTHSGIDKVGGNFIHTGAGNDTVSVTHTGSAAAIDGAEIILGAGKDSLTVSGGDKSLNNVIIYGDDKIINTAPEANSNNDIITIAGSMSGGAILGDAQIIQDTAIGGSDIITVKDFAGNFILGDAWEIKNTAIGGNDRITVNTLTGNTLAGDALTMVDTAIGGSDIITVEQFTGGVIYGDAKTIQGSAKGGNDIITVGTLAGGKIYGDAESTTQNLTINELDKYGKDYIAVEHFTAGEIYGNYGNDTITIKSLEGSGSKIIDGGNDYDIFVYNNTEGHSLTLLDNGNVEITNSANDKLGNVIITNFEGLGGGSGNDTLIGNSQNNYLEGGGGSDDLYGGEGHDYLDGGKGNDYLYGEAGDDQLHGGAGNDELYGGTGNDTLSGGDDDDLLHGGAGNDYLFGGDGNDYLEGGEGNDRLNGGEGIDYLEGGEGNDYLFGGDGNDYLYGGAGKDTYAFTDSDIGVGTSIDTIVDFSLEEDTIDLSAFFDKGTVTENNIDSYIQLTNSDNHKTITLDRDGNGSTDLTISLHGGSGIDSTALLEHLIANISS